MERWRFLVFSPSKRDALYNGKFIRKSGKVYYNSRFIAGKIIKLNDGFSSHVRLLEGYPLPISFSPPFENHGGCGE